MKKTLSIIFFLISCAALGYFYCVKLPIYVEWLIAVLAVLPPRYILLEKCDRWQLLRRVPYYSVVAAGLLVLHIGSPLALLLPMFSFYHPANHNFMYFYIFLNCINCFLFVLYQFCPELLHLKTPAEEKDP